ncbi:pseudouridine synthase [Alienimonas sp. DA493]|uniref:pseudouridine synthase n=1 Tax=Alienimonas sp. DA493 TaxID=3373605 RepID=UPI003754C486
MTAPSRPADPRAGSPDDGSPPVSPNQGSPNEPVPPPVVPAPPTPGPPQAEEEGVRLQRYLAAAGYGARRECEELITAGRVTIDDEVVTELGTKVVPGEQEVRVDGERAKVAPRKYYLLNKPAGVLCTNRDPHGRPRAVDLVEAGDTRLFTVGRLDEHSRGLLIVTNDGELTQKLAHPRNRVIRKYRLQVAGVPKPETFRKLRQGLHFEEGLFRLNTAKKLKTHGSSATVEVELAQGRNREIRRLFARVGHKVMQLERVQFGPLKLGDLAPGKFRPLTREEVRALQNLKPEDADRAPHALGRRAKGRRPGNQPPKGFGGKGGGNRGRGGYGPPGKKGKGGVRGGARPSGRGRR